MSAPQTGAPSAVAPSFESFEPVLEKGTIIAGRYEIERCLGAGGMASVFRARHVALDQPVAIKVVSPRIREVPGVVSRFMREARAATRLKGQHVVRVFDVGTTEDGAPFMVMELLEGRDLDELIVEGFTPSVEQAVDYILQTCEALAEVHGLGIVHRDLKPGNLFVTQGSDGRACIKLIDFGISRFDSPLSELDAIGLTNPDVVMGSPRYMPPEQMESSARVDARSDIWGIGAILYEMLVGDAPFDGESLLDIYAAAICSPPPAPSTLRSDIPPALDAIVLKCLRVDPADRFADVAELASALARIEGAAPARVESIARVLDASRARASGSDEASLRLRARSNDEASGEASHIRRREPSRTTERRRLLATVATSIALVGLGVAAGPIAQQVRLALQPPRLVEDEPFVSRPPLELPPMPPTRIGLDSHGREAPAPPTPRAAAVPRIGAPRFIAAPPQTANTTAAERTESEPAPPPNVNVSRESRTLFEDRK